MKRDYSVRLSDQELDDLLSALSYFMREYPGGKKENPQTMRAMNKLSKKLWKVMRSKKK